MSRGLSKNENMSGLIDKGCKVDGKLSFDGTVRINGVFNGEIISDGTLIVGSKAEVEGTIKVATLIVEGSVRGSVNATTGIELMNGGNLIADLKTTSLAIEGGAIFHGTCSMVSDERIKHEDAGMVIDKNVASVSESESDEQFVM